MKHTRIPQNDWLRTGAIVAIVCVALPVLAVLLFFARFVVVGIAAPALVAGLLCYAFSPRFRGWLEEFGEGEVQYKGLRLATDVSVSPVHSWARWEGGGAVVGSDDLAPSVLGPISTVELPETGRWLRRGEPLARLRRGTRSVVLRAPVSGVVVNRNDALHWRPELVNEGPYTDGWLVNLRSDAAKSERDWLRRGGRAREWFRAEVDRLVGVLAPGDAAMQAVADGGELVDQLHNHIDDAAWQRISASFFDARPTDRKAES